MNRVERRNEEEVKGPRQIKIDLHKLIPKFDSKSDDISLILISFECQAKILNLSKICCVTPSEIVGLIAREPEKDAADYEFVKKLLLQRFKLSPEKFRQLFVKHQKNLEGIWKDFYYEIRSFCEEWLNGLDIHTFEDLKDLLITDQMKKKVPTEVREHFLGEWAKIKTPRVLVEKLDEYEDVHGKTKRPTVPFINKEKPYRQTIPLDTRGSPSQVEDRNKEGMANRRYVNHFTENRHQAHYNQHRITPKCYTCGKEGHFARACQDKSINKQNSPKNKFPSPVKARSNVVQAEESTKNIVTAKMDTPVSMCNFLAENIDRLKTLKVKCLDVVLDGTIDSGAQISVVRADLVKDIESTGEGKIKLISAFGDSEVAPLRAFSIKIDDGWHDVVPITCAVSKKLVNDMLVCQTAYEVLLENIQLCSVNARQVIDDDTQLDENKSSIVCEVQTFEESSCLDIEGTIGSVNIEGEEQANKKEKAYEILDDLLVHNAVVCGEPLKQVVPPACKRKEILQMAHEIPLVGHLGEQKTKQRIKYSFFWPSLKRDVKTYCEACKPCQLRRTLTYRDRIPIQPIVRPNNPFEVWSVDCIGPLEPRSRGHSYIVFAIDLCSRWAEAIPTKNITAKTTCKVLMKIFCQTGIPKTICTDQGTNFTAQLTQAFQDVLGASPRFSTPGHPESMGVVERWNRTLKDMLNKNIQEHGNEWDVYLPYLLFAYREIPHTLIGVSPYQLVYGRLPSGPMSIVKEFWTGEREIITSGARSVEEYLRQLQKKLQDAHEIASGNSTKNQERMTSHYNLRSREKSFSVGDEVLILLPSSTHKLLNTWIGPAKVVALTRSHYCLVQMEDGSTRELHINKLRPYISRVDHVGVIFDQDSDFGELRYVPKDKETQSNIGIELNQMPDVLKIPSRNTITANSSPKRLQPYRVPIALQKEVERQVNELLDMDLIEHSDSDWAHPVVCVAKRDGSIRLCIDFRLVNSFTIPDAYPMKHATDLIYEIGKAHFITVLDLTKGYWQIPMEENSKHFTTFVTHSGHYQWKVLPFGMKNAGSNLAGSGRHAPDPQKVETMSKLLRPTTKKQLQGLIGLASYYRDYIKNFSSIVLPLTNLTKKNIPNNIPLDDKAEESFQCLKKSLIEMPTLYTPVLNRPFQLYIDASATIVGACLAQNDENGREHPIAFYSTKLT
ncbi:retrovirus-related Pol polyprotein from transposon 412 [Trichonephila clavipes]|nr:retrovirus-related Pol polyprotein from transposon 412 [Trichonephila clavipes]